MTTPGWYPDPLGPAGSFRWWDGSTWTEQLRSAEPVAATPAAPPTAPVPVWSQPAGGPFLPPPPPGAPGGPGPPGPPEGRSRRSLPLIIGAAAVVVLLVAAGVFLATRGGNDVAESDDTATTDQPDETSEPDETTTTQGDPSSTTLDEDQPDPGGDRISIGVLSYQALGGEWQPLGTTVPELPGATGQVQVTQTDTPTPGGTFVASVAIGFLDPEVAYTGPNDLQAATLAVAQLIVTTSGAYPSDTTGEVTAAEPRDVDGHPAFVVRLELAYAIPGLTATGESVLIAVVDTGQLPGAFWGSVPNDAPQLVPDMEAAFSSLTVDV